MKRVWTFAIAGAALVACSGGGGGGSAPPAPAGVVNIHTGATATPSPGPSTTAHASPTPNASSTPGGHPTQTPTPGPSATPGIGAYIKHVVIIIQENRSFDNLFNGFPGADTVQQGVMSTGQTVALRPVGLEVGVDFDHSHLNWYKEYAGGKLYFDLGSPNDPTAPYTYVPTSETGPYWAMASRYALADRMFQSNTGPSFVAHQYLIQGTSLFPNGQYGADNPHYQNGQYIPTIATWGCDDPATSYEPVLGPNGIDPPGPFPCWDNRTIADELVSKGLSWRYYAPTVGTNGGIFSAYDAIGHIRFGSGWSNVLTPETRVLQDAPSGLSSVTWVTPTFANSDHPGSGSATGPQWVASVVNAIGQSPDWNSTAIFILWDDWGGIFDHVPPPQLDAMGLGFRVPLIVVSPYAKHGYVSHTQHEFGSILHFTESAFGLAPLAASDQRADDLTDCFDFAQSPQPYQAMAHVKPAAFFRHAPEKRPPDDD